VDAELAARCEARDVHPTGPLPGRGGREPVGQAAEVERAALARHPGLAEALVAAGLEADRRPLRVVPRELAAALAGDVLTLSFRLRRGSFATAVVRELVRCEGVDAADES
jgi:tRNA pseudouridine13 synthase